MSPCVHATPPRSQRGVALITVLLVVALATTAAASMTGRHQFDLRRTANRIALAQAHEVALGGEAWGRGILARDRRGEARAGGDGAGGDAAGEQRPVEVDALDEVWAQDLPPIPIEGGQVTGAITDLQGRFNVNNLVDGDKVDAIALARFERLLATLGIDTSVARAVADWIDPDGEAGYPGGAEDDFYASLDEPYRAANRPIATASELRMVRGVDAAAWSRLAPHVAALPRPTAVNVNTASEAVLRAVLPGLEDGAAEALAELAAEEPFTSIRALRQHRLVPAADDDSGNERLAVGSSHFRVRVDVAIGDIEYTLYSWLARNDNGASRVLRRARTPN